MSKKIISPCISICKTEPITGYCYGCARTNEEKKIWKDEKTNDLWKKENLVNISIKLPLTILIDSKNLKLLKRFEQELINSDLVYNYHVESITNNETIYKIIYNSTPKKFIKNFEDRNFQIDYNNEIWLIK